MGVKYITDQGPDGLSVGKDSNDKIAFHGATPVDKPGSTEDLKDLLVAYGLMTTGGATPLNLDSGALTCGALVCSTLQPSAALTVAADSTLNDGVDFAIGTTNGSKIGTASTQKLGFLGATPVVRQANTADLKDVLVAFGLVANGGATPLNLDSGALTCGAITIGADSTLANGVDFALATSTGSMIGTASTQKLGFLGATPVVRQANTADIKDALVAFGLIANGGATPLNLDSGALTCGAATIGADSTLSDGVDFALGSTNGTKIGTASTQKIGFLNATPVVRQANTADIKDVLVNFGFLADGGATPLNLDAGALTCGAITVGADSTLTNGVDFALGTSTGTKIGTASTQKLGFFNATPIVRPSGASQAAIATTNPVNASTNWGYTTSSQALAIVTLANAMRSALVNLGLLNGS